MNRKELEVKTKADLLILAASLGFGATPAMSKPDLIDMLDGQEAPAPVVAQEEEAALPAEGKLRDLQGALVVARNYRVTIQATENEKDAAKLSVNGHMLLVPRGKEVILSEPYIEVLKSAVIDTMVQDPDTEKMVRVKIQRYPFMALAV